MGRRHHTVILVPHGRARYRKWRVSNRQLILGLSSLLALLVLSGFTTWSYLTHSIEQHQLSSLSTENRQLRDVNQQFESNIRELEVRLSEFEERTRQLAIVAGLDAPDLEQQSGVGGGDLEQRLQLLGAELDGVTRSLDERQQRVSATPSISPVRGILTSGFGYRRDPISGRQALHRAIDLSTAPGHPVVATADGIVLEAERSGRLGKAVVIAHGFGITTRYGHLARFDVEAGERVRRGDVIGFVGNTGRTTGFHLHYEVHVDGRPVNPLTYILDRVARRS